MPAIQTMQHEVEMWLTAEWRLAQVLQRPLADDGLILIE